MTSVLTVALFTALALAQAPTPTKAEQLQDAARKGDAAAVKRLLDEGVDVNTKFRYNTTALFFACDAGHIDVVKVLLEHGAEVNLKDTFYSSTPLSMAVSPARKKTPAHNEIAKLLIAKGASDKDAALGAAVDDNDEALAKAVLDSGGVPAAHLTDALEQARADGKTKIAALLEQAGAKPYDAFSIDPAVLAKFAGDYTNPTGLVMTVTVAGSQLRAHISAAPPDQHFILIAKDATTFRAVGMQGTTFVFTLEGDKATAIAITPVQGSPAKYTRVEKK